MTRALVIIDIQRDYFPGGAFPLVGPEAAADAAARVLAQFRTAGEPVLHLQHLGTADGGFLVDGTYGAEIHPAVAPTAGELVIPKDAPNGFLGTALEQQLRSRGIDELVVAGMMSSMCVDATVRAAVDLGFEATIVHDACAAPDLEFGGTHVPGASVHASFMAALGSAYATLVASDAVPAGS